MRFVARTREVADSLELQGSRTQVLADLAELSKLRIVMLTAFTAGVGYVLASPAEVDYLKLAVVLVGCMLGAAGASAANQYFERDVDALMERTRRRPLPSGRMSPLWAAGYALITSSLGVALLALATNLLAATLLLLTIVLYAGVYTPLKRVTALSTIVGAVPGAMPALIGWAAASESLSFTGWVLFAIMFFWQLPHFLAIGWIYRDDYARAGMRMLTIADPDGSVVTRQVVLYTAALLVVSVMPTITTVCGGLYLAGALVLGLIFLGLSMAWMIQTTTSRAYRVFFGSLIYHALLFSLMLVDRVA